MEKFIKELEVKIKNIEEKIELELNKYNESLDVIKGRREILDILISDLNSTEAVMNKLKE